MAAIAFRSKLEDGAVYLSIERFCAVEGDGKELAKLWVWVKIAEQTCQRGYERLSFSGRTVVKKVDSALSARLKTTEQTPFLASVSEAHESDYACMRHRRGHAGDAVSNTRSTC